MKLGVVYNVFDGEELLEGSIKQIRKHVDYIVCVSQSVSNHNERYAGGLNECYKLLDVGLIECGINYKPELHRNPSWNETRKRNIGLDRLKEVGCTHYLMMDCDEYYNTDDFDFAKSFIEYDDRIESTVVKLKTYYSDPELQITPDEDYFVPFITKIRYNVGNFNNGFYCDPTRKPNVKAVFMPSIVMHHYSWVRKDLERKINNSSANVNLKKYKDEIIKACNNPKEGDKIPFYEGRTLKRVQDYFNIKRYI